MGRRAAACSPPQPARPLPPPTHAVPASRACTLWAHAVPYDLHSWTAESMAGWKWTPAYRRDCAHIVVRSSHVVRGTVMSVCGVKSGSRKEQPCK